MEIASAKLSRLIIVSLLGGWGNSREGMPLRLELRIAGLGVASTFRIKLITTQGAQYGKVPDISSARMPNRCVVPVR
jgi:hypothetical protein